MASSSSSTLLARGSSPSAADLALKAEEQRKYVKELWLLLAAVIGLLTLINSSRRTILYVSRRRAKARHHHQHASSHQSSSHQNSEKHLGSSPEAHTPGRTGRTSLRLLPSSLRALFNIIAFRVTVPIGPGAVASVTEVTFIVGYIVAMLVWLFVDTHDLDTFFFEDRAAHLASCQLPLIVALAGKNNILSFLTGIGHEKLNVLHRAAARTCLVLLWIHALVRGISGLPEKFDLSNGWMRWGVVGLTAFTLATILSIRPIRNMAFEFFLVSHIVLVAIFLVGGFIHARNPGFGEYIYPALVVWAFDRVLRLARVVFNNSPLHRVLRSQSTAHTSDALSVSHTDNYSKATIELLTHDTIRLTLTRRMTWKAGQHAYVIIPSISTLPTEAHPFTIASIPQPLSSLSSSLSPSSSASDEANADRELVFLIRGRTGFTNRLRSHAGSNHLGTVNAYIDGPYGCPPDLGRFGTVVLIAGGSGVSYTLPLLLDVVRRARDGTCDAKRVVFVWVIRDPEHVSWITKILITALTSAPSHLRIEPRIYVTGTKAAIPDIKQLGYSQGSYSQGYSHNIPTSIPAAATASGPLRRSSQSQSDSASASESQSISGSEEEKPELGLQSSSDDKSEKADVKQIEKASISEVEVALSAFRARRGRPDVDALLHDAVVNSRGRVSVDVAGPSALAESVRNALSSDIVSPLAVLKGRPTVELHVETFGMVKG